MALKMELVPCQGTVPDEDTQSPARAAFSFFSLHLDRSIESSSHSSAEYKDDTVAELVQTPVCTRACSVSVLR
jgi:hypothetical protein